MTAAELSSLITAVVSLIAGIAAHIRVTQVTKNPPPTPPPAGGK